MKVKDVLEKLKEYDPESPVMIEVCTRCDEPGTFDPVKNIIPVPFIRGDDRMIAVFRLR